MTLRVPFHLAFEEAKARYPEYTWKVGEEFAWDSFAVSAHEHRYSTYRLSGLVLKSAADPKSLFRAVTDEVVFKMREPLDKAYRKGFEDGMKLVRF